MWKMVQVLRGVLWSRQLLYLTAADYAIRNDTNLCGFNSRSEELGQASYVEVVEVFALVKSLGNSLRVELLGASQ